MSAYARGSILPNTTTPRLSHSIRDGSEEDSFPNGRSIHPSSASRTGYMNCMQGVRQRQHRTESCGLDSAGGLPREKRSTTTHARPNAASGNRPSTHHLFNPSFSGHVAVDARSNHAEMSQLTMSQTASQGSTLRSALLSHRQPQQQMHALQQSVASNSTIRSQDSFLVSQSTTETRATRSSSMPSEGINQEKNVLPLQDPRGSSMANLTAVSRQYTSHPTAPTFATPSRRSWIKDTMTPWKAIFLDRSPPQVAAATDCRGRSASQGSAQLGTMMDTTARSQKASTLSSSYNTSSSSGARQQQLTGNLGRNQNHDAEPAAAALTCYQPVAKEMIDWLSSVKDDLQSTMSVQMYNLLETKEKNLEASLDSKLSAKLRNLDARDKNLEATLNAKLTTQMQDLDAREKRLEQSIFEKERNLERIILDVNDAAQSVGDKMNEYLSKIGREGDAWLAKLSVAARDHAASFASVVEGTLNDLAGLTDKAFAKVIGARTNLFRSAIPFLTNKFHHVSTNVFRSPPKQNPDRLSGSNFDIGVHCSTSGPIASADAIVSFGSDVSPSPTIVSRRNPKSRRSKRVKDAPMSSSSNTPPPSDVPGVVTEIQLSATRDELELSVKEPPSPRTVTCETSEYVAQRNANHGKVLSQLSTPKRTSFAGDAQGFCVNHAMKSAEKMNRITKRTDNEELADPKPMENGKLRQNTHTRTGFSLTPNEGSTSVNCLPSSIVADSMTTIQGPGCCRSRSLSHDRNISSNQITASFAASVSPRKSGCLDDKKQESGDSKCNHGQLDQSGTIASRKRTEVTKQDPLDDFDGVEWSSAGHGSKVRRSKRIRTQPPATSCSNDDTCVEKKQAHLQSVGASKTTQVGRTKQRGDNADTSKRAFGSRAQPRNKAVKKCNGIDDPQDVSKTTQVGRTKQRGDNADTSKRAFGSRAQPRNKAVKKCNVIEDPQDASGFPSKAHSGGSAQRTTSVCDGSPNTTPRYHLNIQTTSLVKERELSLRSSFVSSSLETKLATTPGAKRGQRMDQGFSVRSNFEINDANDGGVVSSFVFDQSPATPVANTIVVASTRKPSCPTSKRGSKLLTSRSLQQKLLVDATNTKASYKEACQPNTADVCCRKVVAVTPNEKKRKSFPNVVSVPPKRKKTNAKRRQSAIAYNEDLFGFLS